jgi:hypothetical protein
MKEKELAKITEELNKQYPNAGIRAITVDEDKGQSTFYLDPRPKTLAYLKEGGIVPKGFKDKAAVLDRDFINRSYLDLAKKDPLSQSAQEQYKSAIDYYYTVPEVGSSVNLLASLASKGFENDIDDEKIKAFYDTWAFDVNLHEVLDWIYLDFFKYGNVTTYKVLAKYEPRVSHLSPIPGTKMNNKSSGAKKKIWSKGHLPVGYTVLNPQLVEIDGNLLFDKVNVKLTPPNELKDLLKKPKSELTEEESELIKALPSELKKAAEQGGSFPLDSRLVGFVTYRKMPYERYAKPRSLRLFDNIEYKRSLKQADLSTLDGITNYILKITVGNDEFPCSGQDELNAVANLFNTAGKSFDVVWNHTLKVEKIVSPEIGDILGKEKYSQVNDDMFVGLSLARALIDGSGEMNAGQEKLVVKGIEEEIDYARRQVTRWIYREYRQIAEAMNFDRFPRIRWDDGVLKDTIMYMNILSQLVDRRMLSYRTALEELGFDYDTELFNMEAEFKLVEDGTLGIIGSPWQQSKVQPVQGGPTGSPSEGRPAGKPAKPKEKQAPDKKNSTKVKKTTKPQQSSVDDADFDKIIKDMSDEDFTVLLKNMIKIRESDKD